MVSGPVAEVSREQWDELTELLLRNVTDYAIILLAPTGHAATWDEGAQRLLGYPADEILGQHVSVFFIPEDRADGRPERELEAACCRRQFRSGTRSQFTMIQSDRARRGR